MALPPSARIYSRSFLSSYDQMILEFSNSELWQCPLPILVDWYDQNITSNHLDLGVGTGYFLSNHRFAEARPRVAVVDINPECLAFARERLRELRPLACCSNVLDPLPFERVFDSVGANYLLHCLPGPMRAKALALEHARATVREGGLVFGSTILGKGVPHHQNAMRLLEIYNDQGIFDNADDHPDDLAAALDQIFDRWKMQIHGAVALFAAWV